MSERAWGHGGLLMEAGDVLGTGRHAVEEDAALTPIFHALTRGGWRTRQESPADAAAATSPGTQAAVTDPLETFRRDPLGAPLPANAPPAATAEPLSAPTPASTPEDEYNTGRRRRTGAHAVPEVRRNGRHHRRLVPVDGGISGD